MESPREVVRRHCRARGIDEAEVLGCLLAELQSSHVTHVREGATKPGYQARVTSEITSLSQYAKQPEPASLLTTIALLLRIRQPLHEHNVGVWDLAGRKADVQWTNTIAKCEEALILAIQDLINQGENMSIRAYLEMEKREKGGSDDAGSSEQDK